jgi:hypothetical protein
MAQRPFANYYGLNFILYEISTPFLNIQWFFDKLSMTGSRIQLYNGIALLTSFLVGRVLWGNYQSLRIYSDVWTALKTQYFDSEDFGDSSAFAYQKSASKLTVGDGAGKPTLPIWLVFVYLGSNTILSFLNVYWFAKMIQALRKRFQPPSSSPKKQKLPSENCVGEHVE